MGTTGERIKEKRLERGMSMDELAERMGYRSRTSIYKIEHNITDLPLSKVGEFAKVLNTTSAYLMGWQDNQETNNEYEGVDNLSLPAAYPIPILGEICCGDGIFCEENYDGYFFVDKDIKADICVSVRGDSMIDAEIYDGDKAFLRKNFDFIDGKIYAVLKKGENLVYLRKVFIKEPNMIVAMPCNNQYSPDILDASEINILGLLVGVYHTVV
jgi:repressor LexA